MKRLSFALTVALLGFGIFALLPVSAAQQEPINVVARISVQLPAKYDDDLKNLVTSFAAKNGFGSPQQATMPRNRKILLPHGAFSMMFRASSDDYYLFVHNVRGQDCVLIDLYASKEETKYTQLLDTLGQTIQQQFKPNAKVFTGSKCETAM